jgi:acyl-CoA synthetase (AMP-forming)/AMP-acid ligase II
MRTNHLSSCLVHHFLEKSAELFPDKIAIVHEERRTEFSRINKWANQLAHCLIKSNVSNGDRIVLLCENNLEYIFCYYGILKAGCIAVSLNTDLKPESLAELLKELKSKVVIVSSKFERTVRSLDLSSLHISRLFIVEPRQSNQGAGYCVSSLYDELAGQPDENAGLEIDQTSCATIIYTSGSAGKPKGVMLSHANIVANTRAIIEYLKLTSSDVQMVVLPFFYVMGMSLLNTHFAVGGRIVINNKFAYTASVLKQMAEEGVTGFSGVPSTYAHLLFKSPLAKYRDKLPRLRYCSQAGGHMPRHIKLELLKILPPHTLLFVMYGATEAAARLTYVPPKLLMSKIDSIGKPIAGVAIEVISPEGKVLRPGETGELVAHGENIMLGYYKDEEATKEALDRHGYHTGDLGYHDDDGFLFVTGRMDDQIKVSGHRINPQDIEDVVVESGHAIECIILPTPDSFRDLKLVGLAVPIRESADTGRKILEYCHRKLPKYKIPDSLVLVDAIPKNSNGKPDRFRSLALYMKKSHKGNP